VHSDNYFFTFFHEADELARRSPGNKRSLAELCDIAATNEKCRNAAKSEIFDKMLDGVLKNAKDEFLDLAKQYQVGEDEIQLRTAELCNASGNVVPFRRLRTLLSARAQLTYFCVAYIVAGAQRQNKFPRMDFFNLHALTTSIFLGTFEKLSWIPNSGKTRLLTYSGRLALLSYISMGAPPLSMDVIRNYKPQNAKGTWEDAIERVRKHPDDGHAVKMIRAALFAEQVSKPYEDRPEFRLKGTDFEKFAVAIVDTLNPKGGKAGPYEDESWIRGAGFDDVWEHVPDCSATG
jgi:hypothetical protein